VGGGIERIRLDDGTVVWARIGSADGAGPEPEPEWDEDGYRDTGFGVGRRVVDMADGLSGTVGGVVRSLRAGLDTTAPVQVSVSFGIELSAQAGTIVSAIASGGGRSSLNVSLTWTEPAREGDDPDPRPPVGDDPAPAPPAPAGT
jgi:hypothetical protein